MSREFEIALNLLERVKDRLSYLLNVEDRYALKEAVRTVIDPVTACAYHVKVGEGPRKEELLSVLLSLVREMRDMKDINTLKDNVRKLLEILDTIRQETLPVGEGGS